MSALRSCSNLFFGITQLSITLLPRLLQVGKLDLKDLSRIVRIILRNLVNLFLEAGIRDPIASRRDSMDS